MKWRPTKNGLRPICWHDKEPMQTNSDRLAYIKRWICPKCGQIWIEDTL